LDDPADPQPRFTADLAGLYVAQLIVFDGSSLSLPDTVVISTGPNVAPHVSLGPNRLVTTGNQITVDALADDANLDALTYKWTLLSRPAGSGATLSTTSGPSVQLTPDQAGDYVVQLTATDPGGLHRSRLPAPTRSYWQVSS
jgi:hypothetical protein